ncbi:hypothetical protein Celaphus_00017180 [Cervus elaphus hippelaphus]|uniref:Uncharacterized protein n=1 Tax=Cervus elaphus hippelaphus TaxID=46360 RepID=A0A212CMK9_CEREH|nr:hypothetical protein Celaphus_00017180 [Cervus elaphus hippelaphus]
MQAAPTLERPCPAPYHVTEGTRGALRGTSTGNTQKPSEAPLTGQEDKPPPQAPTYSFVSRIWHSESVVEAENGSLEPSPHPAMARNEPQEESGDQAAPETCSSVTVMDLNDCSQSVEAGTFEPSLLIKSQIINIDTRRSWSPRSHKNPSSNTKSVATNPEDVDFDEQFHKPKFQGFIDWQKQAKARPLACSFKTVPLGGFSKTESLCCSETLSDSRTCDVMSSGESSQGQQEALRRQPQHKSQHRKFISTDARETNRSPKLGHHKKGFVVQRFYQAGRMSHPGQKKESAEQKTGTSPAKSKPAADTAQRQGTVKRSLIADSKAAEAQDLMTSVGQILQEKMELHHVSLVQSRTAGPIRSSLLLPRLSLKSRAKQSNETNSPPSASYPHRHPTKAPTVSYKEEVNQSQEQHMDLPTQGARSPSGQSLPARIESDKCPMPSPPQPKALSSSEIHLFWSIRTSLSQHSW